MGLSLRLARQVAGLTQMELSAVTGIHQAILSQLETGARSPSPAQRQRLTRALGAITFIEEGLKMSQNVPTVLEARWDENGRPDFSQLEREADQASIKDQLEILISEDHSHLLNEAEGDFTQIKALYPDIVLYEVRSEGQSEIFGRSYVIENGEASLEDDGERVPMEQFKILSRRRVPSRAGVPPMPTTDEEDK